MNSLYEILEICLDEIDRGADMDTVLFRHPEYAGELRPILEASMQAKRMPVPAPSQEVVRRNRVRLLQQAAQMREQRSSLSVPRFWSAPLRRALVSLAVVSVLFAGSTGLVRASSTTLPGDSLYPVKRTWEDALLLFTFSADKREALEWEHENERLDELHELFAEGRSAEVDFSGYVTSQSGQEWRVSGITVLVSSQTRLPDQAVGIGDAVRVKGQTQSNGFVLADEVKSLPAGMKLPEGNDNGAEFEEEKSESSTRQLEEDSSKGSVVETPRAESEATSAPEFDPEDVSIEGVVTSVKNDFVVVNGIVLDIHNAEVKGTPQVGVVAEAEGYYDSTGMFITAKIEFKGVVMDGESDSNADNDTKDNDDKDNSNETGNNNNDDDSNNDNSNDNNANSGNDD